MAEKYSSGQKGYDEIEAARGVREWGEGEGEKTGAVVLVREEKAKTHETWYMTLYEKLFGGKKQ